MKANYTLYLALLILLLGLSNCKTAVDGVEELLEVGITNFATVDTCGDNVVLFQQQVLPLLESSCSYSTCHDADFRAGGISMSSYEEIAPQISPGNPEKSLLYQLITNPDPNQSMPPPPRESMGEVYVNLLRVWIEQGAQNTICKSRCSYRPIRLEEITCLDNGTPELVEDDSISFSINPSGKNLGEKYRVTGPGVNLLVEYGAALNFKFPVGEHITLRIKDENDQLCTFTMEIPTKDICRSIELTATDSCKLESIGLEDVSCFNNETPNDSTDDRILFTLNPSGSFSGSGYQGLGIQGDSSFIFQGGYGDINAFQSPPGYAGKGDVTLIIRDLQDGSCLFEAVLSDPGSCPALGSEESCSLIDAGLGDIVCHDNNTPDNLLDDFFSFSLSPTGIGLGSSFSVVLDSLQWSGQYGVENVLSLPEGSLGKGDIQIILIDEDNPNCTLTVQVEDPKTCIDTCDVSDISFSNTISPLMEAKCVSCHNGPMGSGEVDLSNYQAIKEQVETGALFGSIHGDEGYELMPPAGKLPLCEIQQIKLWIDSGYPED